MYKRTTSNTLTTNYIKLTKPKRNKVTFLIGDRIMALKIDLVEVTKMDVQIKDREMDIECLRMALNMCEVNADYPVADLIDRIVKAMKKHKGNMDMGQIIKLHSQWRTHWCEYFDKLANEE